MSLYEDMLMVSFLAEVADAIKSTPIQYDYIYDGQDERAVPSLDKTLNLIAKNLEEKAKEYARKNFES